MQGHISRIWIVVRQFAFQCQKGFQDEGSLVVPNSLRSTLASAAGVASSGADSVLDGSTPPFLSASSRLSNSNSNLHPMHGVHCSQGGTRHQHRCTCHHILHIQERCVDEADHVKCLRFCQELFPLQRLLPPALCCRDKAVVCVRCRHVDLWQGEAQASCQHSCKDRALERLHGSPMVLAVSILPKKSQRFRKVLSIFSPCH